MTNGYEFLLFILAIITTWAMYLQLYGKPNPFYSVAQATYMGASFGLDLVVTFLFLYTSGFIPITKGDWFMAFGFVLGFATLLRLTKRYAWVSRIPLAIALGTGLGLGIRTQIFAGFLSQIMSLITPFAVPSDAMTSFYNISIVLSTLFMLSFFLYTVQRKGPIGISSRIGEYALYVGLGAYFAQVFMGRAGLLVGYMQNITTPAWKTPYSLGIGVLMLAIVIAMDKYGILEKLSD